MKFGFNWEVSIDFPWFEKIHDYVWQEDEDEE